MARPSAGARADADEAVIPAALPAGTSNKKRLSKEKRCRRWCTVVATGVLDKKSLTNVQTPPSLFGPATYYYFQFFLI